MTEIERLASENDMLKIKVNSLNKQLEGAYTLAEKAQHEYQIRELEQMLKMKTNESNANQIEMHHQIELRINLRQSMGKYITLNLQYFMEQLKENVNSPEITTFCRKMKTVIDYMIFNLQHVLDRF